MGQFQGLDHIMRWIISSIWSMAVVEDNSFEFVPQETAKVFSQSGNSINLKSEQVACVKSFLNGKDVLAVLPTGFGKSTIFPFFVRVKEYMSKDLACILVICRRFEAFDRVWQRILFPKLRLKMWVRGNFNYYSRPLKTCCRKCSSHF